MGEEKIKVWWSIPATGYNQGWRLPAFGLGEMVWWRYNPRQAVHVTGVVLVEGYIDEEDPESSTDQTWEYLVTGETYPVSEENLVGLAGHRAALRAWETRQAEPAAFDPFLDVDDLPSLL